MGQKVGTLVKTCVFDNFIFPSKEFWN